MGDGYGMHGSKMKYTVLGRKTEGKRLLGMPRQKVESNVITYFNEIQGEDVDWMYMAQDGYLWWTIVNTLINLMFIGPCIIVIVEE